MQPKQSKLQLQPLKYEIAKRSIELFKAVSKNNSEYEVEELDVADAISEAARAITTCKRK